MPAVFSKPAAQGLEKIAELPDAPGTINLAPYVYYLGMKSPMNLGQARKLAPDFDHNTRPVFNRGFSRDIYWLRIRLRNKSSTNRWFLTLRNTRLDLVEFYFITDSGIIAQRTGDHLELNRNEPAAYPVFAFILPRGKFGELYIRLRSSAHIAFPIMLHDGPAFGTSRSTEIFIQAAWAAAFLLYGTVVMFFFGRPNYLQIIYLLSTVLFALLYFHILHGDGNLLLWPGSPWMKARALYFTMHISQCFALLFLREFLNLSRFSPRLHRAFLMWAGATMILFFTEIAPLENHIRSHISVGAACISSALFIAGYIQTIRLKRYWTLYLLAAWLIMLFGGTAFVLLLLGIIPYHPLALYGMVLAGPVEMILVTTGLFRRYTALKKENEELARIKEQLMKKLEPTPKVESSAAGRLRNIDTQRVQEALLRFFKEERVYLDEGIRLDAVARRLGIRGDQLSALLNLELGISFSELLNRYRVEEARHLLKNEPSKNILEIALNCGFGSRANFNKAFKKITGTAPIDYRRRKTANDIGDD